MTQDPDNTYRIVLITGPSGAGRSSAIRALEDLGFEAIDNLPLRLIKPLLDDPLTSAALALGIDPRTRDFSADAVLQTLSWITHVHKMTPELLYLDCDTPTLLRRFSETRRRHPLADKDGLEVGIERELELLSPLRDHADVVLTTSNLNVHQLRAEIERWYGIDEKSKLSVRIQSFSYKRGLPQGADMVFDCRFLKNPYWVSALRSASGLEPEVAAYVASDPRYASFVAKLENLCLWLLPAFVAEGKAHLLIAFGCTGGQHRSVTIAEAMSATLARAGWQVSVDHRDLTHGKAVADVDRVQT